MVFYVYRFYFCRIKVSVCFYFYIPYILYIYVSFFTEVLVLVSNHDTEFVREAYKGAKIKRLQVRRFISSDGTKRGKVREVLALFDEGVA